MSTKKIPVIKTRVIQLLTDHPHLRNNDFLLQLAYLRDHEGLKIEPLTFNRAQELSSIMESIRRCRQHIQNDEKRLVPTSHKVAMKRRWNSEEWRLYWSREVTQG